MKLKVYKQLNEKRHQQKGGCILFTQPQHASGTLLPDANTYQLQMFFLAPDVHSQHPINIPAISIICFCLCTWYALKKQGRHYHIQMIT